MPAKKKGSTKRNEQPIAKEDDSAAAKTKEQAFVWTDDETELLLKVTLEYKVAKAAESVDWESIRSKYQDILSRLKVQMPSDPEEAKRLNKDYPAIRLKYRQAVDSGRKSGHGRVVLMYFELCEKIWGGSPATEQMQGGVETTDLGEIPATGTSVDIPPPEDSKQTLSRMLSLAPMQ